MAEGGELPPRNHSSDSRASASRPEGNSKFRRAFLFSIPVSAVAPTPCCSEASCTFFKEIVSRDLHIAILQYLHSVSHCLFKSDVKGVRKKSELRPLKVGSDLNKVSFR